MQQSRYHIQLGKKRTTIVVDSLLSTLLAFKLGLHPDEPATHGQLRQWFEAAIHDGLGQNLPAHSRVSQWARVFATEAIAERSLMEKVQAYQIAKQNG